MTRLLRHEWHTALYDPEIGLSIVAKVVGCALIEHANPEGVAWPGLPELGAYAGATSRHTVIKGLQELEARGLLVIERRAGRVNRYRIVLPSPTSARDAPVPVHEPVHEPVHDVHPNQGTREPIRPSVVRADPQKLVGWYIDHARELGAEPPKRLVGQVAQQVRALSNEGYDESTLQGALALLLDRRLHPSTLTSLIIEAQAGPRSTRIHVDPVDLRYREAYGRDASELLHDPINNHPAIEDGSDDS